MRSTLFNLGLFLLLVFVPTSRAEIAVSEPNVLQRIESDMSSGRLTLDEKVILQVKAIRNIDQLPQKYLTTTLAASKEPIKCGTSTISGILDDWDKYSPATQIYLSMSLARNSRDYEFDSPSGIFKLHYDTEGSHAVPTVDADLSGIPDYIEKCAAYFDTTAAKHLELGYLSHPSDGAAGGDSRYDIYFENLGSVYGFAITEAPGSEPWDDETSYIMMHKDYLNFPSNSDPEGDWQGAAKATAAHEYHHAVQFAYDPNEGLWWMELDATYMEDIVFDNTNDNLNYLSSFFAFPEKALTENTSHAYSSFIWGMYLAERFDTSLLVAVWEGARYDLIIDAISDTLQGRYGWSQDSAVAEFTAWNYITGLRDDGLHYGEGSDYPLVAIHSSHISVPVTLRNVTVSPAGYAASYVLFDPTGAVQTVRITFDGSDGREWAAFVIKSIDNVTHEIEYIDLDPVGFDGEILIDYYSSYDRVILVGVNTTEFSSGANFSYSAEEELGYSVYTESQSEPAIYSGSVKEFAYYVHNTSANADIFDLIVSDSQGWIVVDTSSTSLWSGVDSTFMIPVSAPLGTPIGSTSTLKFKVISWGDPEVADSVMPIAEVTLQQGDANFSGVINISDVTYLVSYLFGIPGGPVPVPVLIAGDFNCNGEVNISDISAVVEYLFGGGPAPFCNPY